MLASNYRLFLGAAIVGLALAACGGGGDEAASCQTGEFCPCSAAVPCPDVAAETCDLTLLICIARVADVGDDAENPSDVSADVADAEGGDTQDDAVAADAGDDVMQWPDAVDDQLNLFLGYCLDLCALQRDCAPEGSDAATTYDVCAANCQAPLDAVNEGSGELPESCVFAILDYFSCASQLTCEFAFEPTDPDGGCADVAAAQAAACPAPGGE